MKSVGDFYVNIIPKLDQIALNTGISAVNASLEMLNKGIRTGKQLFTFFDDSARNIAEMKRFADSIDQSFESVQRLGYALKESGLNAGDAQNVMESMIDSWHKMQKWGDADWAKLSMYDIADFRTGNIIKDLLELNKRIAKLDIGSQREALSAMNLSPDLTRILGKEGLFGSLLKSVEPYILSSKQASKTVDYVKQMDRFENIMNKFKVEFVANAIPAITSLVDKINKVFQDKEFIDAANTLANAMIDFVAMAVKIFGGLIKTVPPTAKALNEGILFKPSYATTPFSFKDLKTTVIVEDKTEGGVKATIKENKKLDNQGTVQNNNSEVVR